MFAHARRRHRGAVVAGDTTYEGRVRRADAAVTDGREGEMYAFDNGSKSLLAITVQQRGGGGPNVAAAATVTAVDTVAAVATVATVAAEAITLGLGRSAIKQCRTSTCIMVMDEHCYYMERSLETSINHCNQ